MIVSERLHQRCCFFFKEEVVPALRTENGGLNCDVVGVDFVGFYSNSMLSLQFLEAFSSLVAVAMQRIGDDREPFGRGTDFVNLDRLAFQLLVILKEAPKHHQAMRGNLFCFGDSC